MAHAGGRPRKYEPEQLYNEFLDYMAKCVKQSRFANIAGFQVYLMIKKSTYYDAINYPEFSDTKKKVDLILEDESLNSKVLSPPEKIFYLKNKFGYKDKQEIDNTNIHIEADDITDTLDKLPESERAKAYAEIANASASEVLEIVAKYKK